MVFMNHDLPQSTHIYFDYIFMYGAIISAALGIDLKISKFEWIVIGVILLHNSTSSFSNT